MKQAKFLSLFLVLALLGSLLTVGVSANTVDPMSLWYLGHNMGYQSMEQAEDGVKFTQYQGAAAAGSNDYISWLAENGSGKVDFSQPVYFTFTINELSVPVADADNSYGWATVPCFAIFAEGGRAVFLNIAKTSNTGNAYIYTSVDYAPQTQIMQPITDLCCTYYVKFDLPNGKVLFTTTAGADESTWVNIYPSDKAITSGLSSDFTTRMNFTTDAQNRGKWVYTVHSFNGYDMAAPATGLPCEEGLTLDNADAAVGETVTITVDEGKTLKAGSLQVVDAAGNVLAVPKRVGFRTNTDATKFTFTMPEGAAAVNAEFVAAGDTTPNMAVEGWSYNESLGGLRSVHRVYNTAGATDYGVLVGTVADLKNATTGVKKVSFKDITLRYDACDAYEDLSVTVTGLDNDTYKNTTIYTCTYVVVGDQTYYSEVASKTYAQAAGLQ